MRGKKKKRGERKGTDCMSGKARNDGKSKWSICISLSWMGL